MAKKPQIQITPRNSFVEKSVPSTVPRRFLSLDEIREKETTGDVIIFVVEEKFSSKGSKGLRPIRNTDGKYLVVICQP